MSLPPGTQAMTGRHKLADRASAALNECMHAAAWVA